MKEKIVFTVLLFISALLFIVFAYEMIGGFYFKNQAESTIAVVTAKDRVLSNFGRHRSAQDNFEFVFVTQAGVEVKTTKLLSEDSRSFLATIQSELKKSFKDGIGQNEISETDVYSVGDKVPVLYRTGNPQDIRIDRFDYMWGRAVLAFVLTSIMLLVAGGYFMFAFRRAGI